MFLSEEKISHLSHLILDQLKREKGVQFKGDEVQVLREIKRVFAGELKLEEELDRRVRAKLESYSRRMIEGSPEWNVLYQKTFEEELKKRKRG